VTLEEHIAAGPQWVRYWVMWMGIINMAAVLFLLRWKDGGIRWGYLEAVIVLAVLVPMAFFMDWLFGQVGYVRLLGLPHIVLWTPLAIYLWFRLAKHPSNSVFGIYLRVLLATIVVSLAFDYTDVVRYLLGDGTLT
jgi:hypothetical protein